MASPSPLRIGYVPEHFSTPLHFAKAQFSLTAQLIPFPSGTGHMINALQEGKIDVGIGLTEGWVAGLGNSGLQNGPGYKIIGTYVETPLCWAISTGSHRGAIHGIADLKGAKMGVSRIGSGSYVMGFVLADQEGWLSSSPPSSLPSNPPFEVIPLNTFGNLRKGVNDDTADFFMWEHFTSKRYFDNGDIKRIGEIYTPWSSWMIVAATELLSYTDSDPVDPRLEEMFEKINAGIRYFLNHPDEAVKYISTQLDYSEQDAREWLKTVEFANGVEGVDLNVIEQTIRVLKKAGVIEKDGREDLLAVEMIGRQFRSQRPQT